MMYRCKYTYERPYGNGHHVWTCIGRRGAIHFHVSDLGEKWETEHGERYSGGLEIHHREPPSYMVDHAPSQDKCWLIGGPCWHDGTSLYASEHLIPMWRVAPDDHDRMFQILQREYENQFNTNEEAA